MIDNRITTIFFDVGRTLRKNVPNPATRDYWLKKIISTTGISWTPDELARQITCRLGAYKKWASESLKELRVYDFWRVWILPEAANKITHLNAPELNRYSRRAIGDGILLPHASDVIRQLFKRGYRLGVISNTVSVEQTPDFLKETGLSDFFETIVLSCNFGKRKPDPSIFYEATNYMDVDPKNCAYVGDQYLKDIIGSIKAGFSKSVLLKHENSSIDVSTNLGISPSYVISDLSELLDIFPPLYQVNKNGSQPPEEKLEMWNISLSTMWSYERIIGLLEVNDIIKQLHISGIELNHSLKLKDLTGIDLGALPITSIHEPCPSDNSMSNMSRKDWLISSEDEDNRRQGVRSVMRSIELAANLGVKLLITHPGNTGWGNKLEDKLRVLYNEGKVETEEYQELFHTMKTTRNVNLAPRLDAVEKSLKELLVFAGKSGVKLSLENRYHYMHIPTIEEMERFLHLGDESQIGFQFDIGHAFTMDRLGFMPIMEWLEKFGSRISGVHLHDVRGLEDHISPGLGDVDFNLISKYIPNNAVRTLEIKGINDINDIHSGLEVLGKASLIKINE
jgi:FMN phosphatase YigB (HAD superfamily)/sugar phosphate isomerase/epimerase